MLETELEDMKLQKQVLKIPTTPGHGKDSMTGNTADFMIIDEPQSESEPPTVEKDSFVDANKIESEVQDV